MSVEAGPQRRRRSTEVGPKFAGAPLTGCWGDDSGGPGRQRGTRNRITDLLQYLHCLQYPRRSASMESVSAGAWSPSSGFIIAGAYQVGAAGDEGTLVADDEPPSPRDAPPFSPQRRAPESKQDRHLHVWGRATAGRLSARLPASVLRRATGPAGRHKTAAVPSKPLKSAPFSTAKSLPCARAAARPLASRPGGCAVRGPWTGRQQRPPEPSPAGGQDRRQSGARGSVQAGGNCGPSQVPRPGPARGAVGDRRGGANLRVGCS